MIDPIHLLSYIIRPVLKDMRLWSVDAERLLLGTACAESDCGRWLRQRGEGPAVGIYQMEPATYQDIWQHFLNYRHDLYRRVLKWSSCTEPDIPEPREMIGNLNFATAMCRVHYLRSSDPIPSTLKEQAEYWKRLYNTEDGKGTINGYLKKWDQFVPAGTI